MDKISRLKYVNKPVDGNPLTPVFASGTEGYASFRIPSIVRAGDGSLVAFAEGRVANSRDFGGPIRIVCRWSQDNGLTWGALQVVGSNILPDGREFAASNPSPLVDRMHPLHPQGVIFLVFNKAEFSEHDTAAGKGVRRVYLTRSLDHGATWEESRDITEQVHRPYNPTYTVIYLDAARRYTFSEDWRQQVTATGHGIQLQGGPVPGRLFYTASITIGGKDVYHSQNYAFWSDDHGDSWHIGGVSPAEGLNEAMAVELEDGSVMVNARNYRRNGKAVGRRAVMVNRFDAQGNITFGEPYDDPNLIEPTIQASIERYSFARDVGRHPGGRHPGGRSRILFSITDHPRKRQNMTVRLSYDEGRTWPIKKTVDPGPAGYSDLVLQQDEKIGLLYERGEQGICYVSFSLDWLTDETLT